MKRIHIDNINVSELQIYNDMSERQLLRFNEPAPGLFIAESPKVIERALRAGYEPVSILAEEQNFVQLSAESEGKISEDAAAVKYILSRCEDIPVYLGMEQCLKSITGFKLTRGMLCAMKRRELTKAESICSVSSRLAVLESVTNPTNLGAIIRSAAALSIDGILLTGDCTDPLYRRCIRVSMGNIFSIPWAYIPGDDINQFLHDYGFKTLAMALSDRSIDINNSKLQNEDKLAILLGNEGLGLRDNTVNNSDYIVKIPMAEGVDSLNVAAASAVAFWELVHKKE